MTRVNVDQLNGDLEKLYGAAKAELDALEGRKQQLIEIVNKLGPLFGGKKTYSLESLKATSSVANRKPAKRQRKEKAVKAPKVAKAAKAAKAAGAPKKERIKEEVIRKMVLQLLGDCAPNSMSPVEIIGRMVKDGMPGTASFRTRVYNLLTKWSKEGLIRKVGRGVYQLADVAAAEH